VCILHFLVQGFDKHGCAKSMSIVEDFYTLLDNSRYENGVWERKSRRNCWLIECELERRRGAI
jgi:hypothetical protein